MMLPSGAIDTPVPPSPTLPELDVEPPDPAPPLLPEPPPLPPPLLPELPPLAPELLPPELELSELPDEPDEFPPVPSLPWVLPDDEQPTNSTRQTQGATFVSFMANSNSSLMRTGLRPRMASEPDTRADR